MVVYALPDPSSGNPHPLDVVMFNLYKNAINKALCDTFDRVGSKEYSVFDFYSIVQAAYHEFFTRDNILASFWRSGIFPIAPSNFCQFQGRSQDRILRLFFLGDVNGGFRGKASRDQAESIDSVLTGSVYLSTTAGCALTSSKALHLIKAKERRERHERENRDQMAAE